MTERERQLLARCGGLLRRRRASDATAISTAIARSAATAIAAKTINAVLIPGPFMGRFSL